jgi:hypothetical protein
MDWVTVAAVGVPAVVTLAGFLIGYLTTVRSTLRNHQLDRESEQLRNQLERVNRQLSELYGPLLALSKSSGRSWDAFRSRHGPETDPFWGNPRHPVSEQESETWRRWMLTVFAPMNDAMERLVVEKADLLDSPGMPEVLLDLVAHVASYRAVFAAWENGDYEVNTAPLNFPRQVEDYAEEAFRTLKARQQGLLGRMATPGSARSSPHGP